MAANYLLRNVLNSLALGDSEMVDDEITLASAAAISDSQPEDSTQTGSDDRIQGSTAGASGSGLTSKDNANPINKDPPNPKSNITFAFMSQD